MLPANIPGTPDGRTACSGVPSHGRDGDSTWSEPAAVSAGGPVASLLHGTGFPRRSWRAPKLHHQMSDLRLPVSFGRVAQVDAAERGLTADEVEARVRE